ncbi:MAG: hypothetical protein NTV97_15940 [Alphaproteobacteria bacterium]|nr:hypothetical protein [Alphaproteobacteria bacterium]
MRVAIGVVTVLFLSALCGQAHAQPSPPSAVVQDLKDGLARLQDAEKKVQDWSRKNPTYERDNAAVQQAEARLKAEVGEVMPFCSGTYPEPEFRRRKAICDPKFERFRQVQASNRTERSRLQAAYDSYQAAAAERANARSALNLKKAEARINALLAGNCPVCPTQTTPEAEAQCYIACWDGGRR